MTIITKMKNSLLRLLFPLRCPVCDGIVRHSEGKICAHCEPRLKLLTPPWCLKCGKKVEDGMSLCEDCQRTGHTYDRGRALYEYASAAPGLYRFKYSGRQEYADFYADQAAEYLGEFIKSVNPDALIPIPLHPKRKNKRGYNQAEVLALRIGEKMDIPVYSDLLLRSRNTRPLKRLSRQERQNNLKNAFIIRQNDVKLGVTILIDDIYTTGATIDEAAGVLKAAGAREVYFLSLACGAGV